MFFNPLASDTNYKVLATAQMTITDQTDASNLAGNMTVVNGSKSQTYLTGNAQPYNPDWKTSNLVLRPYMIATNIYRGNGDSKYNPDLFDPKEYPNLEEPGDLNSGQYIYDIQWYIVDSANNQTLIDISNPKFQNKFSHTWTYQDKSNSDVVLNDKRTLVIKDNILNKNEIASIMIKFAFHDPFADIRIPVSYEVQINNIATGAGTSKAFINAMDGNSFYNADENQQLRLEAQYFDKGIEINLDETLSSASSNLKVEWFMRTMAGWTILDPITQDSNAWNEFYEIHRVTEKDSNGNVTKSEKTYNAKGGTLLIVRPDLIAGSEIIKLVVTDDTHSDHQSSALETIYDYSDPTQCYIHSSNGDKLYKGMNAPGTTLSAVVTYKGELFEDGDERYNTMFDYYWYRIDGRGDVVENMYLENGTLKFIKTTDPNYTAENDYPKSLARDVNIQPKHIDNKATFSCDLLNKKSVQKDMLKTSLLRALPLEDELKDAKTALVNAGINKYDYHEIMNTATEMRAFSIAQEDQIINSIDNGVIKNDNNKSNAEVISNDSSNNNVSNMNSSKPTNTNTNDNSNSDSSHLDTITVNIKDLL